MTISWRELKLVISLMMRVVKLKYDDIKKKKSYRYLVFYIKDEKVIQVEKVGDRNADYQEFLQDLYVGGPDDCR